MSLKIIGIVRKLGEKRQKLERAYRKIRGRDLFLAAYGKLYAKSLATTPGASSTVDGMSLKRIDKIIEQLEYGTVQFQPVFLVYIEKKNGQLRPLGLPGWNDKLRKVSSEWY